MPGISTCEELGILATSIGGGDRIAPPDVTSAPQEPDTPYQHIPNVATVLFTPARHYTLCHTSTVGKPESLSWASERFEISKIGINMPIDLERKCTQSDRGKCLIGWNRILGNWDAGSPDHNAIDSPRKLELDLECGETWGKSGVNCPPSRLKHHRSNRS
ncbi:hypothetical protein K438DRAFT_1777332 [Mycena galopus ATCC 62051]|nr:hypothetical protein K438DRAFT_1777332 [Mycena galopus ATCC 62051]